MGGSVLHDSFTVDTVSADDFFRHNISPPVKFNLDKAVDVGRR